VVRLNGDGLRGDHHVGFGSVVGAVFPPQVSGSRVRVGLGHHLPRLPEDEPLGQAVFEGQQRRGLGRWRVNHDGGLHRLPVRAAVGLDLNGEHAAVELGQ